MKIKVSVFTAISLGYCTTINGRNYKGLRGACHFYSEGGGSKSI